MNEKTQGRVADKLLLALETEKLMNKEAAAYLDVPAVSLSLIKRSDTYNKVSKANWEKIHDWYNSGLTLGEWYSRKPKEDPAEQPETTPEVAPKPPVLIKLSDLVNKGGQITKRESKLPRKARKSKDIKGSFDKGKPSKEEIDRVLATLGIEIEVIVKLKNQ